MFSLCIKNVHANLFCAYVKDPPVSISKYADLKRDFIAKLIICIKVTTSILGFIFVCDKIKERILWLLKENRQHLIGFWANVSLGIKQNSPSLKLM